MKLESDSQHCYLQTHTIVKKSKKFWKNLKIAQDHNLETEYARNVQFVSNCAVLDTLPYSTNNSISTESGFLALLEMSSSNTKTKLLNTNVRYSVI